MRTVIAFDISDPRVRYRVTKVLKAHAQRVQRSVFEGPAMTRAAYLRMRSQCEGLVVPETDSLRYYVLCANCVSRIEHFGVGPGIIAVPEPFDIIG